MDKESRMDAIVGVLRDEVDRHPNDVVATACWHLAMLIRDVLAEEAEDRHHDAA